MYVLNTTVAVKLVVTSPLINGEKEIFRTIMARFSRSTYIIHSIATAVSPTDRQVF